MDVSKAVIQYREMAPWTRTGLAAFLVYCAADDTSALRAAEVVEFLRSLARQSRSADTIRAYRSAINGFFRWLCDKGLVSFGAEALEAAFMEQATVVPRRTLAKLVGPDEGEVGKLIEAAYAALPGVAPSTPSGRRRCLICLRNIAMVETLRATGIRAGELVALRRGDLDAGKQVAYAPDGRVLYFDLASWGALARYLEARGDGAGYAPRVSQAPVFARHDAGSAGQGLLPLHVANVSRIVRELGGTEGLTAPALRIRFGQRLLAATADEKGTARLLGLKKLASVRRYGD